MSQVISGDDGEGNKALLRVDLFGRIGVCMYVFDSDSLAWVAATKTTGGVPGNAILDDSAA